MWMKRTGGGYKFHFVIKSPGLIIRAQSTSTVFELVPHDRFSGDFPTMFIEDYVHWLDLNTSELESLVPRSCGYRLRIWRMPCHHGHPFTGIVGAQPRAIPARRSFRITKNTSTRSISGRSRPSSTGPCLDCLDRSKPKTGDIDHWRHHELKEHVVSHTSSRHGCGASPGLIIYLQSTLQVLLYYFHFV